MGRGGVRWGGAEGVGRGQSGPERYRLGRGGHSTGRCGCHPQMTSYRVLGALWVLWGPQLTDGTRTEDSAVILLRPPQQEQGGLGSSCRPSMPASLQA